MALVHAQCLKLWHRGQKKTFQPHVVVLKGEAKKLASIQAHFLDSGYRGKVKA
jgi:hypothetical protein